MKKIIIGSTVLIVAFLIFAKPRLFQVSVEELSKRFREYWLTLVKPK